MEVFVFVFVCRFLWSDFPFLFALSAVEHVFHRRYPALPGSVSKCANTRERHSVMFRLTLLQGGRRRATNTVDHFTAR